MEACIGFARNYVFRRTRRGGGGKRSVPESTETPVENSALLDSIGGVDVSSTINDVDPTLLVEKAVPVTSVIQYRQNSFGKIYASTKIMFADGPIKVSDKMQTRMGNDMEVLMLRMAARALSHLRDNADELE